MDRKLKVKVVKKATATKAVESPGSAKTTRMAAREMVSTVTDWVTEFKSRKGEETKSALDQLFSTNARPNES